MFRIYLAILLSILVHPLKSQKVFTFQTNIEQLTSSQSTKLKQIPSQISLKQYTPYAGDQKKSNSCVGWAIGYGAMSIQEAKAMGITDRQIITKNAYSAAFIYHQIKKESCNVRVPLIKGIEITTTKGNLKFIEFNNKNVHCTTRINSFQKARAQKNIIPKVTLLFKKETTANKKVTSIKVALAKGYPVVCSMSVRKNFYQLKGGKYWWPNIGNTTPMGGHALVVIAYDDKKQAFQLMNSWGTEWGRDGFVWIKYKDFACFSKHAFCLAEL